MVWAEPVWVLSPDSRTNLYAEVDNGRFPL
ncbi:hypothetical protein SEA_AEGEUS_49 [Mycobacterium phage Aegeus]|nr:hypothetical protein SEA_BAUDELAIRE_49 [Mycobacterium phage Baudelaire]WKW86541.1 hypothetical protein SEA_AEGEUS_49 [Mycobacterium phage Aegeus]